MGLFNKIFNIFKSNKYFEIKVFVYLDVFGNIVDYQTNKIYYIKTYKIKETSLNKAKEIVFKEISINYLNLKGKIYIK